MIDLNTILNELTEDGEQQTPPAICFYPGGFKPPHEGHFEVLKDLASRPYITKVIVLIGHKTRDGITKEQSKRIWDLYLATSPISKAVVKISEDTSPIKDIFSAFNNDLELKAYVAGAKNEVEEQDYFTPLQKAFSTRVMPLAIEEKVVTNNKRLSGTQVRELVTKLKQSVLDLRSVSDKSSIEYSKNIFPIGLTLAVTLPDDILSPLTDKLVKPLPSPLNDPLNDPDNGYCICLLVINAIM